MSYKQILYFVLATTVFCSCRPNYSPKPHGYYQFDFPPKKYSTFDTSICPCTFEYPDYGYVEQEQKIFNNDVQHPCWVNIVFPDYNAKVYLSYSNISNRKDFEKLLQDSYKMTFKHSQKADFIDETLVDKPLNNVFGYVFDVGGDAASGLQFFATDSTKHFVRGALYFNNTPNADSIQPALEFFREDVLHLINSVHWR